MTVTVPPTGMEVNCHLSTSALNKEASPTWAEFACCFVASDVFFLCGLMQLLLKTLLLKKKPSCFCFEVATGKLRPRGRYRRSLKIFHPAVQI